jgi:hypothetical protein
LPEELTYQSKLRAAMSGVVGESDVTEVVKEIVAKAKTGDRHAQKMFFEYLVGVKNAPTKTQRPQPLSRRVIGRRQRRSRGAGNARSDAGGEAKRPRDWGR